MVFRLRNFTVTMGLIPLIASCQQKAINEHPEVNKSLLVAEKKLPEKKIEADKPVLPVPIPAPTQKILPTKLHKISHKGITFNLVTFDSRKQFLVIADQVKGPGSTYADAQTATKTLNGIAGINAGFFTPEGKPLGLVVTQGTKRGSYNTSSLGSGIFYQTPQDAYLQRRTIWAKLSKKLPANLELLQSGPMLLENSKTIAGLSSKNSRVRSFIATDGKNHWCIAHASDCTLAELSIALSTLKVDDFKVVTALNLDGGRSSDLWVSPKVSNGPLTIRRFWNKDVRNFLILKNK